MAPPTRQPPDPDEPVEPSESAPDLQAAVGPLLAGARADGIAEGLEMLGVGALLIDATGRVVRVGSRGQRLMEGWLRIVAGHLVAGRADDDKALAGLIGAALAGRPSLSGLRLRTTVDAPVLTLRAVLIRPPAGFRAGAHAAIVLDEA